MEGGTLVATCAAVFLAVGCDEGSKAAQSGDDWPAGTVLVVDSRPIRAEEIDPIAAHIALLYPQHSRIHCRRLAVTNVTLPGAAARTRFAADREAAERLCHETARLLPETPTPPEPVEASWTELGLDLWSFARELEPGVWSEPTELVGRFVLVRLDEIHRGASAQEEELVLQRFEFPYVDPANTTTELREAMERSTLEIVDPDWREVVPEYWQHQMKGGS